MRREEWETLPWWRVVNKKGVISAMKLGQKGIIQKQLLEAEGVVVEDDTIDMEKYNV